MTPDCGRVTNNLFYFGLMLGSAQLSGNRFLNFGILAFLETPSTIVALFVMTRSVDHALTILSLRQAHNIIKVGTRSASVGLLTPLCSGDRLVGLAVKASTSRAEDPVFESRLRRDFSGVESYQ